MFAYVFIERVVVRGKCVIREYGVIYKYIIFVSSFLLRSEKTKQTDCNIILKPTENDDNASEKQYIAV